MNIYISSASNVPASRWNWGCPCVCVGGGVVPGMYCICLHRVFGQLYIHVTMLQCIRTVMYTQLPKDNVIRSGEFSIAG